jgi:integral membrane sensor domain MASE1
MVGAIVICTLLAVIGGLVLLVLKIKKMNSGYAAYCDSIGSHDGVALAHEPLITFKQPNA